MFQLMRNTHLILGLVLFLFAFIFAVSSLVIIYRPWLPDSREDTEQTIRIDASKATSPRSLALELIRNHGFAGDLRNVNEEDGVMKFRILRPGTHVSFEYTEGSNAFSAGQNPSAGVGQSVHALFMGCHVNQRFLSRTFSEASREKEAMCDSSALSLLADAIGVLIAARTSRCTTGGCTCGACSVLRRRARAERVVGSRSCWRIGLVCWV